MTYLIIYLAVVGTLGVVLGYTTWVEKKTDGSRSAPLILMLVVYVLFSLVVPPIAAVVWIFNLPGRLLR